MAKEAFNTSISVMSAGLLPRSRSIADKTAVGVLISIAVTPTSVDINTEATQQLTAIGTYSDATTADLTLTATWSVVDSSIITVDSNGLATAVVAGTTTIKATVGAIDSNLVSVTVVLVIPRLGRGGAFSDIVPTLIHREDQIVWLPEYIEIESHEFFSAHTVMVESTELSLPNLEIAELHYIKSYEDFSLGAIALEYISNYYVSSTELVEAECDSEVVGEFYSKILELKEFPSEYVCKSESLIQTPDFSSSDYYTLMNEVVVEWDDKIMAYPYDSITTSVDRKIIGLQIAMKWLHM